MKNKIGLLAIICLLQSASVLAWNALGHRLIAQIAYDNMTSHARMVFNQYNSAMDVVYKPLSFINASVWLDNLRYQDISWFSTMHYVDLPFSADNTPLPTPQEINAIWAIEKSSNLLRNKYAKPYDKGMALRIILHISGDLHQPLHAATQVSVQFPQGDRGGNLVHLKANKVARNLHSYWDRGAGLLKTKRRYSPIQIEIFAKNLEKRWPCRVELMDINPVNWANESHILAVNNAYKELPDDHIPDKKYQSVVQKITEKQIALAGCRLGALLNHIV